MTTDETEKREALAREIKAAGVPEADVAEKVEKLLPHSAFTVPGEGETRQIFAKPPGSSGWTRIAEALPTLEPAPAPKTRDEITSDYLAARRAQSTTPAARQVDGIAPHAMSTSDYLAWRKTRRGR